MSRHPGNPYWHQDRDIPITILDQATWNEVVADGYLTAEHVLVRVSHMAAYEFGNGADAGLAEDGFFNALVADRWQLTSNVKARMWPDDHVPPHVHLEMRQHPEKDLRVSIETGQLLDDGAPPGTVKQMKRISALVREMSPILMERWTEMQAATRPSS